MIGFNLTTDEKKIKPNAIKNIPTGKQPLIGLFQCSSSEMEMAATLAPSVVKTMNYLIQTIISIDVETGKLSDSIS